MVSGTSRIVKTCSVISVKALELEWFIAQHRFLYREAPRCVVHPSPVTSQHSVASINSFVLTINFYTLD